MRPSRLTRRRAPTGRGVEPAVRTTVATASSGSVAPQRSMTGARSRTHRVSAPEAGPHKVEDARRRLAGMEIANSFSVAAPADRVYDFLLDVNNVVRCVPGAELAEVVDPDTFTGKVKIKVGPVTVSYNGTARITQRDAAARRATLRAEGRETVGSGSANATTTMSVQADGGASVVTLATDFTVVGRIAQFGRGIMEDVSRQLVGQMAECIRTTLEAAPTDDAAESPVGAETPPSPAAAGATGAADAARSAVPHAATPFGTAAAAPADG